MPYPNEHACRIRDPKLFKPKTYGRYNTGTKGLEVITAKLKSTGKTALQAYRYKKKYWSKERARKHCNTRGGSFEGASTKKNAILIADHTFLHLAWNKSKKAGEWRGWTRDEIVAAHAALVSCLEESGIKTDRGTTLDVESAKLSKQLTPSDIPNLLIPGGQTLFQSKKKKKKKRPCKKVDLSDLTHLEGDDITAENLQNIGFTALYNTHKKLHGCEMVDKRVTDQHTLVVDEFNRRELLHHYWGELDKIYQN